MFSAILRSPKLCCCLSLNRNISALYITGEKASETFAVLTPHIDLEERLQNKQQLENNIKLRQMNINLDDVTRLWNFYKHVESKKINLEESKTSISRTILSLSKKGAKYADKIETLKAHGKMVKEDLKVLKESFWSVEEKAAIQALSLPNELHSYTPENEIKIIHSFLDKVEPTKTAENSHLIEYNNPYNYYLKNEAALFELNCSFYLSDKLLNKNYIQFSNSDFARSVVVEGAGLEFSDPTKVFSINEMDPEHKHENSRLHLIGGASLSSFMAFYCKHTIFPSQLPLKYFTIGRKYQPPTSKTHGSLLNVSQETAVNLFVATKDDVNVMTSEFENVLRDVIEIYESLNYHFRVCYLPAKDLHRWESLRASVQMFSPTLNEYVEIGNISLCGNYVSKRLLFNYGKGMNVNYPCVISGTILSAPKLLACLLESNESLLPNVLKNSVV